MIATVDVEIQAANPNMPLHPWRAFVGSPSSLRIRNVPRRVGDWHITSVKIVAAYPDGEIKTAVCVLTGGIWVGTIGGTATSGTSTNGYTVFADGEDEKGNPITGYILGKGDTLRKREGFEARVLERILPYGRYAVGEGHGFQRGAAGECILPYGRHAVRYCKRLQ